MIVVDAGAVVAALTIGRRVPELLERLHRVELHVPHVIDLEVMGGLRGLWLSDKLPPELIDDALDGFYELDLIRHGHAPLRSRIWQLRHNLTPYDAAYIGLAEVLEAPLITTDGAMATVPGSTAAVELFSPA